jgi:hypothetical protein
MIATVMRSLGAARPVRPKTEFGTIAGKPIARPAAAAPPSTCRRVN